MSLPIAAVLANLASSGLVWGGHRLADLMHSARREVERACRDALLEAVRGGAPGADQQWVATAFAEMLGRPEVGVSLAAGSDIRLDVLDKEFSRRLRKALPRRFPADMRNAGIDVDAVVNCFGRCFWEQLRESAASETSRLGRLVDRLEYSDLESRLERIEEDLEPLGQVVIRSGEAAFLSGPYPRLSDAYIDPSPVFDRVRVDRFVGRKWLRDDLDDFIARNDRGYYIIEAKAGVGKTAFLAFLVRERGWIHHFAERAPGPEGVIPARKSLAAQLISAFELQDEYEVGLLDVAATRPDFLASLLRKAGAKRQRGARITVVVDGLDEAGTRHGENVLGLPDILPEGVFFVCSMRPVSVVLDVQQPRRVIRIEPADPRNMEDVRSYLERVATSDALAAALVAHDYEVSQFVDVLEDKSEGVWVYLHYVIQEIEQGRPLDLEALPQGLWGYYAKFWRRWRSEHEGEWYTKHLPLLAALAANRSPLTLGHLWAISGTERSEPPRLPDQWRPFLEIEGREDPQPRYGLHHGSFGDFLHGRMEFAELTEDEQLFVEEVASATQYAHSRIADHYLSAWGGVDSALPGLQDESRRHLEAGYGLRYVAFHLIQASREKDLHRVLWLERKGSPTPTNVWFDARDAAGDISGYLNDVGAAWQAAQERSSDELDPEAGLTSIGLQIRCALLECSVRNLAANIPPALLVELVDKNLWEVQRACAYARQLQRDDQRVDALASLAPRLPPAERAGVLAEALHAAREIPSAETRYEALAALAPQLSDGERASAFAEALDAADSTGWKLSDALVALAPDLPAELIPKALAAARTMAPDWPRSESLLALAPVLPSELLSEALASARTIEDDLTRSVTLARLSGQVLRNEHSAGDGLRARRAIVEALAMARAVTEVRRSAPALIALLPEISGRDREEVLVQALRAARTIPNELDRSEALATLAPQLPESERTGVLAEAFEVHLSSINKFWGRSEALTQLAVQLPKESRDHALVRAANRAFQMADDDDRYEMLAATAAILRQLPEAERTDRTGVLAAAGRRHAAMLSERLAGVRAMADEGLRSMTLSKLVPDLPVQLLPQALAVARAIADEDSRSEALTTLSSHLPEDERAGVLDEAVVAARAIVLARFRARALTAVALAMPEQGRARVLAEAVRAAREIADPLLGSEALAALAPQLPHGRRERTLAEALRRTRTITNGAPRCQALTTLLPHIAEEERSGVLAEAISAARAIADPLLCSKALAALAPQLPDEERGWALEKALERARAINSEGPRCQALTTLLPHIAEEERSGVLAEAISAARAIAYEGARAEALGKLAEQLPEEERAAVLDEALHAARATTQVRFRARALLAIAPQLLGDERAAVFGESLLSETRSELMHRIGISGQFIVTVGGPRALRQAVQAICDVGRWFP